MRSRVEGLTRRSGPGTGLIDSNASSNQNISGAIVNGHLVNNVMLQGNGKMPTSRFENAMEDDFEDADVTMKTDTERLKQYPEEYEWLMSLENTEKHIIGKQMLFLKHEKELRKQAKREKQLKEQKRQLEKENASGNVHGRGGGNGRRQSS